MAIGIPQFDSEQPGPKRPQGDHGCFGQQNVHRGEGRSLQSTKTIEHEEESHPTGGTSGWFLAAQENANASVSGAVEDPVEKFKKEQAEIEAQLQSAREYGKGEPVEEQENLVDTGASLVDMLGLAPEPGLALHQARREADEAKTMVNQLQQQHIAMIMQQGAAMAVGQHLLGFMQQQYSPKRSSPQLPSVGPFKRMKYLQRSKRRPQRMDTRKLWRWTRNRYVCFSSMPWNGAIQQCYVTKAEGCTSVRHGSSQRTRNKGCSSFC